MSAVYKAIGNVSEELLAGISKGKKNQQQGFMFRGIDDVYNALAPALVKHGLVILPRIMERTVTERTTQKGGVLFYVVVRAEFDFVSVEDGSKHTVVTFGEAMDSGDKATNKAMSIAYKYAAFQAFCIPTEETAIDADATVHHVAPLPNKPLLNAVDDKIAAGIDKYLADGLSADHVIEKLEARYTVHQNVIQYINNLASGQ